MPVTHHGNTVTVRTPGEPRITGINLRTDVNHFVLPDASTITGQATFVMGGVTRTAVSIADLSPHRGNH